MLSIDEAIMSEMNQHEFSDYNNYHKQLAALLEELKSIREIDLSIPQHFTKEQSNWIKAYYIQRNKEFYNKAVDDFTEKIIRYVDCGHLCSPTEIRWSDLSVVEMVKKLAEQLKAGGENEI